MSTPQPDSSGTSTASNSAQAEFWTGERGRAWVRRADQFDAQLATYAQRLIAAANLVDGNVVLDVGCGAGVTSLAAAQAVSPTGRVVGVDISPTMLDVARARAIEASISNVSFDVADAQTCAPPVIDADVVISRFGVMFFADPVEAFTNIASMAKQGARLAFVCWDSGLNNEWMVAPALAVADIIPLAEPPAPDAPGPFSFSDAERVTSILDASRWTDVQFEEISDDIYLGGPGSIDDAIDFVISSSALAGPASQLADSSNEQLRTRFRDLFVDHHDGVGVKFSALARLVTARRS